MDNWVKQRDFHFYADGYMQNRDIDASLQRLRLNIPKPRALVNSIWDNFETLKRSYGAHCNHDPHDYSTL